MPSFRVKVGTGAGEIAIREAVGSSAQAVRQKLVDDGYFVFSVKRAWTASSILSTGRRISPRKFIIFNREFKGLVKAGVPVVEGLQMVLDRMKPGALKALISQVRDRLVQGDSISDAFGGFEGLIPSYYPALLVAGEQSGQLPSVLERFIGQETRLQLMKRKFRNALTYPMFLLVVGMVALYVIMARAMPQFAGLYSDSGQALPWSTQAVIDLSHWTAANGTYLLLAMLAGVVGVVLGAQTDRGRMIMERLILRVPLLGKLWVLQNQNAFAWTMNMLLSGGTPAPEALTIAGDSVSSRVLTDELTAARGSVMAGSSLEAAIDKHVRFDSVVGDMVRIGESTGTLDEMFAYVAENGEDRAGEYLELVSNLVAPIVLLCVGVTIAALVMAMYLPMFGVADLIASP